MSYYDYSNTGNQDGGGNSGGGFYGGGFNQQQQQQQQPGGGFFDGGANAQQWQQPQSDPMQGYPGSAPQGQQQQQQQNFWNPATMASVAAVAAGGMNNDSMLDFASNAAGSFLQSGTARMVPGLESSMLRLRRYFAVDNYYVRGKMLKIIFPFRSKNWKRVVGSFSWRLWSIF